MIAYSCLNVIFLFTLWIMIHIRKTNGFHPSLSITSQPMGISYLQYSMSRSSKIFFVDIRRHPTSNLKTEILRLKMTMNRIETTSSKNSLASYFAKLRKDLMKFMAIWTLLWVTFPYLPSYAETTSSSISSSSSSTSTASSPSKPIRGYQTRDGLIYFDVVEPDTNLPTPNYGQFVSFYYSLYYQESIDKNLLLLDSNFNTNEPFLNKHGNNRVIRGIDEALHTMTVGSKRRMIIPVSLGYNRFALGPLPLKPENRRKLSKYLTLVEENKGKLIADVELVYVGDDENDQGYYDDIPVSQEEVRSIVDEVQQYLDEARRLSPNTKTSSEVE